mmetsp:Transcript_41230/g.94845  ORF Transcript_41230/g.94845 Transcript_41230/m.94845 type:complete len:371 (+) Transcript_41230:53-1165(+)
MDDGDDEAEAGDVEQGEDAPVRRPRGTRTSMVAPRRTATPYWALACDDPARNEGCWSKLTARAEVTLLRPEVPSYQDEFVNLVTADGPFYQRQLKRGAVSKMPRYMSVNRLVNTRMLRRSPTVQSSTRPSTQYVSAGSLLSAHSLTARVASALGSPPLVEMAKRPTLLMSTSLSGAANEQTYGCALAGGHRRFLTPGPGRSLVVPRANFRGMAVQTRSLGGRALSFRAPTLGVEGGRALFLGLQGLQARAAIAGRFIGIPALGPPPGEAGPEEEEAELAEEDVPESDEEMEAPPPDLPELSSMMAGLPEPRPMQGLDVSAWRPTGPPVRARNTFRNQSAIPGVVQTLSRRPLRGVVQTREEWLRARQADE